MLKYLLLILYVHILNVVLNEQIKLIIMPFVISLYIIFVYAFYIMDNTRSNI